MSPPGSAENVLVLVTALDDHDPLTRGHSERVRELTDLLAEGIVREPEDRERLRWGALLHDIGKLRVPPAVLNKNEGLTPDEWRLLQDHPNDGVDLAAPLTAWLSGWTRTIAEHHEHHDGTGYPQGLSGTEISLGARIVTVADAFDTMTTGRPYRRPLRVREARREILRQSGRQFDPEVTRALAALPTIRLVRRLGPVWALSQVPVLGRAVDAVRLAWVRALSSPGGRELALRRGITTPA